MKQIAATLAVMMAVLTAEPVAHAGSDALPVSPFTVEDAADFSKQIERDLAARGARVALVFRTGRHREELPEGVRYTHGAFWVWSEIELEDGTRTHGYAVHNLYHYAEAPQRSYLTQDWPLNFTRGDVVGEVGVILPSPEMQRRIWLMLANDADEALHQPNYSLISNPHDARYQNCNEYLLDVVAAAAWETTDRDRIKTNLASWFDPVRIRTGLFERILAPSVDERLRLEDHRGPVRTTTYRSLASFMSQFGLSEDAYELRAAFLEAADHTLPAG